jgi:hypothetical protein
MPSFFIKIDVDRDDFEPITVHSVPDGVVTGGDVSTVLRAALDLAASSPASIRMQIAEPGRDAGDPGTPEGGLVFPPRPVDLGRPGLGHPHPSAPSAPAPMKGLDDGEGYGLGGST